MSPKRSPAYQLRRDYNPSHYKSLFRISNIIPLMPPPCNKRGLPHRGKSRENLPMLPVSTTLWPLRTILPRNRRRVPSADAPVGKFNIAFRKLCSDNWGLPSPALRIATHSRMVALPLEGNRGGGARVVQCCAPYRHQHAETRRCRNGKRVGPRARAQRRRETAEHWGDGFFGRQRR